MSSFIDTGLEQIDIDCESKKKGIRMTGQIFPDRQISILYLKYLIDLPENEIPESYEFFRKRYLDFTFTNDYLKNSRWRVIFTSHREGRAVGEALANGCRKGVMGRGPNQIEIFDLTSGDYFRMFLVASKDEIKKVVDFRKRFPNECAV